MTRCIFGFATIYTDNQSFYVLCERSCAFSLSLSQSLVGGGWFGFPQIFLIKALFIYNTILLYIFCINTPNNYCSFYLPYTHVEIDTHT